MDELTKYKEYVKAKLAALTPVFANASIGDFSTPLEIPEEDDEFTQLYVGIQVMLDVIRNQLASVSQANAALDQKIEELEALFESIGEGIIATNIENKIIMMNQQAEAMLGWKYAEARDKSIFEVVPMLDENGQEVPQAQRPSSYALSSGKSFTDKNHYYVRKDKTRFPIVKTATPIILHGKLVGIMNVFRDVTSEKELDQLKDDFISLASHELRTPLSAIKGLVSMVRKGDYGAVNENLEKPLGDIAFSTERLIYLVRDLLNVSRIEGKRLVFNLADISFSEVAQKVIEGLSPLAIKKGVGLSLRSESHTQVQADRDKLIELLNNLIGNALKFTYEGTITIYTKDNMDAVDVYIEDTGIGIAQENHKRLFKKFQKIHTSTVHDISGSGLGLYLVKSYAQQMGGDAWLERSEVGRGTTFAFSLPKAGTARAQEIKQKHVMQRLSAAEGNTYRPAA